MLSCFFLIHKIYRLNMALRTAEEDPNTIAWTFSLVNIVLHALCVQLLAYIARTELNCTVHMSFMIGLHFATHPVHTEAVRIIENTLKPSYIQIFYFKIFHFRTSLFKALESSIFVHYSFFQGQMITV